MTPLFVALAAWPLPCHIPPALAAGFHPGEIRYAADIAEHDRLVAAHAKEAQQAYWIAVDAGRAWESRETQLAEWYAKQPWITPAQLEHYDREHAALGPKPVTPPFSPPYRLQDLVGDERFANLAAHTMRIRHWEGQVFDERSADLIYAHRVVWGAKYTPSIYWATRDALTVAGLSVCKRAPIPSSDAFSRLFRALATPLPARANL
jgi:hypothetical protein